CLVCLQSMPDDGRFLTCSECSFPYHIGNTCSGVAQATFSRMGSKKRRKWRCRTCRAGGGGGGGGRAASVSDADYQQPE
ncbi:hypothetical protein HPB47_000559, partial [Ixodes persulcatus]